jgi:hypothetical protein
VGIQRKASKFLKLTYRVASAQWQTVEPNLSRTEPDALVLEVQRVEVATG